MSSFHQLSLDTVDEEKEPPGHACPVVRYQCHNCHVFLPLSEIGEDGSLADDEIRCTRCNKVNRIVP